MRVVQSSWSLKGDMLISYNGELGKASSVFVDTPEVDKIVGLYRWAAWLPAGIFIAVECGWKRTGKSKDADLSDKDSFWRCCLPDCASQIGSTSLLQRRMKLGYNHCRLFNGPAGSRRNCGCQPAVRPGCTGKNRVGSDLQQIFDTLI